MPPPSPYSLPLHDALPILPVLDALQHPGEDRPLPHLVDAREVAFRLDEMGEGSIDRKSTRLNSSHRCISYAVFCLKKKKDNVIGDRFSAHVCDRARYTATG